MSRPSVGGERFQYEVHAAAPAAGPSFRRPRRSCNGEALKRQWRIFASCECCPVREEITGRTLLWTRGHAFPLDLLASRLRCPVCGSRRVRVAFDIPLPAQPTETPIYSVHTENAKGEIVELVGREHRFASGERLFAKTVALRPGNIIVFREGTRVVKTYPPRET